MNVFDRIKRMRAHVAVVAIAVMGAACSNPANLAFDEELPSASSQLQAHLKWDRPEILNDLTATHTTAAGQYELINGQTLFDGNTTSAEGYAVSFWAVKGEASTVELTLDGMPIVTMDLPALALSTHADGSPIALGDSVMITMELDQTDLAVNLSPAGLQFNTWAQPNITISYDVANADFNADGVVNQTDSYIEQNLLGIWSQPTSYGSWSPIESTQSGGFRSFSGGMSQLSGYAVSW